MAQLKDTSEGLAVRGLGYKQFDDGIPVEVDAMVPVLKKDVKKWRICWEKRGCSDTTKRDLQLSHKF